MAEFNGRRPRMPGKANRKIMHLLTSNIDIYTLINIIRSVWVDILSAPPALVVSNLQVTEGVLMPLDIIRGGNKSNTFTRVLFNPGFRGQAGHVHVNRRVAQIMGDITREISKLKTTSFRIDSPTGERQQQGLSHN